MLANQAAFLAMTSHSEGTDRVSDPYRCCYAFRHTIADLSYHPAEPRPPDGAREWAGEPLDELGPQYAGEVSTAAGRYQINWPTWHEFKTTLRLANFSPASQDDVALELVKRHGALDAVNAGQLQEAIYLCRGVWASFPGNSDGQPEVRIALLRDVFTKAGGILA
jgi:muramidase (phage lysozyme)